MEISKHNIFLKKPDPSLDSYDWLESWKSKEALEFIEHENKRTTQTLEKFSGFEKMRSSAEKVLGQENPISGLSFKSDGLLYRLTKNDQFPSGLLERQLPSGWQVLIDFGKLSDLLGETLYYSRITNFFGSKCLLHLSQAGTDACRILEFDPDSGEILKGGFDLSQAKGSCYYLPDGSILNAAEDVAGERTLSSGCRRLKWHPNEGQGPSIHHFEVLQTISNLEMGLYLLPFYHGSSEFLIHRMRSWDESECSLVSFSALTGRVAMRRLFMPEGFSAIAVIGGDVVLQVTDQRRSKKPGHSFYTANLEEMLAGPHAALQDLLLAERGSVLEEQSTASWVDGFWGHHLTDFRRRPFRAEKTTSGWQIKSLDVEDGDSFSIQSVRADGAVIVRRQSFLTPPEDILVKVSTSVSGWEMESLQRSIENDWGQSHDVEDHFCQSSDGTEIHYFLIRPRDHQGQRLPVYLTAYGGFAIARLANYSPLLNQLWLGEGGGFVVANIRGGGEFGQDWHFSARREGRQRCYEDLAAVCEDLFKKNVTSKDQLVFAGGSNGGLLAGNMYTQFSRYFAGILCMNPLLDMRRYHHLFSGRNWMLEYGDPDVESDWNFMKSWSPFHNVKAEEDHPPLLITTAITDDRVHPGHARKMAALIRHLRKDYFFYESLEGGHSGNTHIRHQAYEAALKFTFLWASVNSRASLSNVGGSRASGRVDS